MSFNKSELLSLPAKEKIELAEALWSSVEEEILTTQDEKAFAEERLKLHEANPGEGMTLEAFKKYFADKYGL
jgi:putative addiction module component (TIGR02574 family)